MILDDSALTGLLAGEPDVALGHTAAGPVLYRRSQLLTTEMTAPAAVAIFGDAVTDREDLDDLGMVRLWLRPEADALALWESRRKLVRPVHVFSPLPAVAGDPAPAEVRERFDAPLFADEIEIARLFRAAREPVLFIPFAGPTVDDRLPPALTRAGDSLPGGSIVVAPAGDQASARPMFPGALPGVLAVAAIAENGRELTPTSGWGDWVDGFAPAGEATVRGTAVAAEQVAEMAAAMSPPLSLAGVAAELARLSGILRGRRPLRVEAGTPTTFARATLSGEALLRLAADERWHRARHRDINKTAPPATGRHPGQQMWGGPSTPILRPGKSGPTDEPSDGRGVDEPPTAEPTSAERAEGEHWLVGTRLLAPDGRPMPRDECLVTATTYGVQIVVGHVPQTGVLETAPAPLSMRAAPSGTEIEMIVQPLDAGLTLVDAAGATLTLPTPGDREETASGQVRVRTLDEPGRYHLRCLLYSRGSLLQARLITVEVRQRPTLLIDALQVEVDFTVATTLDRAYLDGLEPVALSVFVNSSDGGDTHDIVYRAGGDGPPVTGGISVLADEVGRYARQVRARLRRVSWGNDEPWKEGTAPRYGPGRPDTGHFFADLETLALSGYRLWGALFPHLARLVDEPFPTRDEIRALLGAPGAVELSARESLKLSIPATFLYDHPLREAPAAVICPEFAEAYASGTQFLAHRCFTTGCAYEHDDGYYCPSGFWGLRHQISLVRSVGKPADERDAASGVLRGTQRGEAVSVIEVDDTATGIAAATTDPRFTGRLKHLERLDDLFSARLTITEKRDEALTLMSAAHDHVVYFFCHGIRTADDYPGLVIGAVNDIPITQSTFGEKVRWRTTRPLVFINGCETAALEPDSAYTLVGTLVQECGAAGVIGTETTIFEPTATRFAEVFYAAFLNEGLTVGEAVRRARLSLLEEGNPLGLGYTAYAPVSLRLKRRA